MTIGQSRRGRKGVVVAAVLVIGLAAGAYVAGRGSDSTVTATSTTTSTAHAAAATTTTAPSTSTSATSTTTTAAVRVGGGPVLSEPTGESVYAATPTGDVYRVDLDTGDVIHYDLSHRFENVVGVVATDDGALVYDGYDYDAQIGDATETLLFRLHADGSVETLHIGVVAGRRLADPIAGGVWLIGSDTDGSTARLVGPDGSSKATISVPPGLGPLVGDGGALVASGTSGVFRVDEGGPHRMTTGAVIGISARFLVTVTCDDAYRCTVTRTDRRNGHVDAIGPLRAGLGSLYAPGLPSPDGHAVTFTRFGANRIEVVRYDLDTNTIETVDSALVPDNSTSWTSTGWLVRPQGNRLLLSRGDDERSVDVGPERMRAPFIGIAIGPTPGG